MIFTKNKSIFEKISKKKIPIFFFHNFIFPSFKTTHTTLFWFLGDTQGARFYDKHGTTLHLFVILFPVQYMEKRFALESFLIKISEIQKPARVEEKRREKYFF